MKGTIVCCLKDMVVEKFGLEVWQNALEKSGIEKDMMFLTMDDVPDEKTVEVITNLCKALNITLDQAADAFGEFWAVTYAPRVYKGFYLGVKNAKEFLLRMENVHDITTRAMKDAKPPHFIYEEKDKNTLLMTYESKRNLFPIFKGLVKGVGKYFNEDLKIKTVNANQLEIVFPG